MMKLLDIAKAVGGGILNMVAPGAGTAVVDAINAVLPDDKKLSANATGHDVMNAYASLPPEQQAQLQEKEFEVDIATITQQGSTLRAAIDADVNNPQTTRPYIAKGSFLVVAFASITTIAIWAIAVLQNNVPLVAAIKGDWQFVLAVIGPEVMLLRAYFGVLKAEHQNKLAAASGNPNGVAGLSTAIARVVGAFKS